MTNLRRKTRLIWALILVSGLFFLSLEVFAYKNELALGESSKVDGHLDLPINPMVDLNFKSSGEIMTLRKKLVSDFPEMLKQHYNPSRTVFGQIQSGKPWWGIIGCTVYGSGKKSIIGPSEETRFLLNPYLLVGAASWSNEIWDKDKLTRRELESDDFPFCWMPSILRYYPSKKIIQVAYEVSKYNQGLKKYDRFVIDKAPIIDFGLIAYNARDFGYNYLYVPCHKCKNIKNTIEIKEATKINQYIHSGGSSGYPGGSNNMSPKQKELDHFLVESLPAQVMVKLWRQKPSSLSQKPDLVVFIELR